MAHGRGEEVRKYRMRPIEAEQWHGQDIDGVVINRTPIGLPIYGDTQAEAYIETSEGRSPVSLGDWVITGVNGGKFLCKPGVFEANYELVKEEIG